MLKNSMRLYPWRRPLPFFASKEASRACVELCVPHPLTSWQQLSLGRLAPTHGLARHSGPARQLRMRSTASL